MQDHEIDWYGRYQAQSEWRSTVTQKLCKEVMDTIFGQCNKDVLHVIPEDMSPPSSIEATLLPTDARIRQKERLAKMKEAGIAPKKKQKYTEPGNDDCGDDISGLGKDAVLLSCDMMCEDIEEEDDATMFLTIPSTLSDDVTNVYSAVAYLCYGKNNRVDLVELCGGEGRISQVAFSRGLISGGNFDLVTGCDLGDPETQKALTHYFNTCYVSVAILQPNCRTVGPLSHINWTHAPDTTYKHYKEDLPHKQFCREIALLRLTHQRHFLREQPKGTTLNTIDPWPKVLENESVLSMMIDQCMAGQKDDWNQPVRKMTEITASDEQLLKPLQRFACNHLPGVHGTPTGTALSKMRIYPWPLCKAIVRGIELVGLKYRQAAYPTIGTSSDDLQDAPKRLPAKGLGCPACNASMRYESPAHTRNPATCRWPNIQPTAYGCPTCKSAEDQYRNPRA